MTAADILQAFAELDPLHNFLPGDGYTHCNQFIEALCDKLKIKMLKDLANHQFDWLDKLEAVKAGWSPCTRVEAQPFANAGKLVLVVFKNAPNKHGHIAAVHPISPTTLGPWIHITQAGGENFIDKPLVRGFGFNPVKFWANSGPASQGVAC